MLPRGPVRRLGERLPSFCLRALAAARAAFVGKRQGHRRERAVVLSATLDLDELGKQLPSAGRTARRRR